MSAITTPKALHSKAQDRAAHPGQWIVTKTKSQWGFYSADAVTVSELCNAFGAAL
jgi:hypothetical protein